MTLQNKRVIAIVASVVLILLVPFTAMQLTDEVNWSVSDFIIAGGLLLGTGLLCELVLRLVKQTKYRIALIGVLLIVLILIWIELAVGLFGTPWAGN